MDDLARAVGRIQPQLDGGLRRVRADTDHLRESVALLRATAAAETAPPPHREPRDRSTPRTTAPWLDGLPDDEGSARRTGTPDAHPASRFERRASLATGTEPTSTETLPSGTGVRSRTRAAIATPSAHGPLVAGPGHDRRGPVRLRRVLDVAGLRERGLLRGPVRVPVLLAVSRGELRAHAARPQLGDLRQLVGPVPTLLILIFPLGFRLTCTTTAKGLLPRLLGVAAGLRGGRAAQEVQR